MTAFGMNEEETREYLENVGGTPGRDGPGNGAPNWRNRFYGLPDKYDPSGDPEKQPKVIDRILHESAKRGRKQSAPGFQPVNVEPCPVVSEPEPVAVGQPGYCVQIKVYGEWRTQKAGMEGAAAGNMRDGMARMGYEARVMYGPGVEADPAPVVQEEPQTVEAGNGEYTREEIEAACVRLMEERDTYRGPGSRACSGMSDSASCTRSGTRRRNRSTISAPSW